MTEGEGKPCREGHPSLYVLAQRACRNSMDLFPQNLLYVCGDFHTFGPFPEVVVVFQVGETIDIRRERDWY